MDWLTALWGILVQHWTVVFGIGVPFIAGAIAKTSWSKSRKTWAAAIVSVLVGVLATFVAGFALTPTALSVFAVSVFTVAQLAYPVMKEKIGLTGTWLDKLLAWRSAPPTAA